MTFSCLHFSSLFFDLLTLPSFLLFVFALFLTFCNLSFFFLNLHHCPFFLSSVPFPHYLSIVIHSLPCTLPLCDPSNPLFLHYLPIIASPSPFYYQTSACVSGPSTWSTSLHSVMVSLQTNSSPWSGSLSCSAKPTRCFVPETWVLSSATSSSQSWTTWRPSGVTTLAEICWRPWRESSSLTPWGWQQVWRVSVCWSVWIRMTMRRAGGCFEPGEWCHSVMEGVQGLTGLYRLIGLWILYHSNSKECNSSHCCWKTWLHVNLEALSRPPFVVAIYILTTRWHHVPSVLHAITGLVFSLLSFYFV